MPISLSWLRNHQVPAWSPGSDEILKCRHAHPILSVIDGLLNLNHFCAPSEGGRNISAPTCRLAQQSHQLSEVLPTCQASVRHGGFRPEADDFLKHGRAQLSLKT
jgi:hypothetical protein